MNKNNYAVIMAGGVGTRFWPEVVSHNLETRKELLFKGH